MPQVPVTRGNSVSLNPRPVAAVRPAQIADGFGEGAERLGAAVQGLAAAEERNQIIYDQAAAKKLYNVADTEARTLLYSGDDAFYLQEGFNAVEAQKATREKIEAVRERLIGEAKNDRQRAMFVDAFDARMQPEFGKMAEYTTRQTRIEEGRQSQARAENSANNAVDTADDPEQFMAFVETGLGEIENQAGIHGWGADATELAKAKYRSSIAARVVDAKSISDPVEAAAWMERHGSDILPDDRMKLTASLHGPLMERWAYSAADTVMGVGGADVAQPSGAAVSMARMIPITATTESGARDYDGQGRAITSNKGARFAMQVMPATARDPGYGIKPAADDSPEEYNRVGRELLGKFMGIYGDPAKAWAAYNWSKKGVDNLVSKYGADWLQHAPEETRNYVATNVGMLGGDTARYAPRRDDLASIYARVDAMPWSYEQKKAVREEIEGRVRRDDMLKARQEEDAKDRAYTIIEGLGDGFTSINQIPAEVRRNLSPEARGALINEAKRNVKAEAPEANGDTYLGLHLMAIYDPERFEKADLRLYRADLTAGEFASLTEDQAKMRVPDPKKAPSTANIRSEIDTAIKFYGKDIGLDGIAKRDNDKKREQYFQLSGRMRQYVDRATEGGKKPVTDDLLKKAFDYGTMTLVVDGDNTRMFEIEGTKRARINVPEDVRNRIIQTFRKVNNRLPTTDEIGTMYLQNKGRPGFWS